MMLKILIVDDDKNVVKMLAYKFKKYFSVQFAYNGAAALETIEADFPDVILLDYMMPEMSGPELAGEILKLGRPVPILMLTAKNDTQTIVNVAKIVDDYIIKPFDFNDVLIRVLMALLKFKEEQIKDLKAELQGRTVVPVELTEKEAKETIEKEPVEPIEKETEET